MQLVPGGSPDPEWVQLTSTLLLISSSSTVFGSDYSVLMRILTTKVLFFPPLCYSLDIMVVR